MQTTTMPFMGSWAIYGLARQQGGIKAWNSTSGEYSFDRMVLLDH
jgi:hypothetical protein